MILYGEPSTSLPSPKRLSVMPILKPVTFKILLLPFLHHIWSPRDLDLWPVTFWPVNLNSSSLCPTLPAKTNNCMYTCTFTQQFITSTCQKWLSTAWTACEFTKVYKAEHNTDLACEFRCTWSQTNTSCVEHRFTHDAWHRWKLAFETRTLESTDTTWFRHCWLMWKSSTVSAT